MSYSILEDTFIYKLPAWQLLFKLNRFLSCAAVVALYSAKEPKKIRSEEQAAKLFQIALSAKSTFTVRTKKPRWFQMY